MRPPATPPDLLTPPIQIVGKNCSVVLSARPHYCDRGRFLAQLFLSFARSQQFGDLHVDHQDGWPRYYFDQARAQAEVVAWLKQKAEFLEDRWTPLAKVIHFMQFGSTACSLSLRDGQPNAWPPEHLWSNHWPDVNCAACLKTQPEKL